MTIENRDLRKTYELSREGKLGARRREAAEAADRAFGVVVIQLIEDGLLRATDDRAENLVTQLYKYIWESNSTEPAALLDL